MPLLQRLWRLEGTVSRLEYLIGGVIGFALKYTCDWLIAEKLFHRAWSPLAYWHFIRLGSGQNFPTALFVTMLAVSLPFLWFGMTMTLLRLREAGRSAGWAALMFMPVANVIMFIALTMDDPRYEERRDFSGVMESALFAMIASIGLAIVLIALFTRMVRSYGVGLFIAVPFCTGYLAAWMHRRRHPGKPAQPYIVAAFSIVLLGGFLLAMAWEGAMCLVMALPLALIAAMIGAWVGGRSAAATPPRAATNHMAVLALPLLLLGEQALHPAAPLYRVDTAITIDAPIAEVWKNVVTFSDIPGEPEWYFRAGIAYPLRARIAGRGAGAIRRCEFTTGAFIEPIEVWNEPRLLRFGVTANPQPMRELSPYGAVETPHLDNYMVSRRGQFALRALPGNRTEVIGTTWYQHHLWPASYWRLWSDAIIHRIHLRVLRHVKDLSERRHA